MNPRRVIWLAMLVGIGAAVINTATNKTRADSALLRIAIAGPIATAGMLAFGELAPQLAEGVAITFATGSLLGGKAAADFLVTMLGGTHLPASSSTTGASPASIPSGTATPPVQAVPTGSLYPVYGTVV